jgi:alpha-tubulin suppressor-like RCC1 family protein
MNRHRGAKPHLGRRGATLVAGALALMSITGCGSAVPVASPTSAATLSPTTGAAPVESTATQSPAATQSTVLSAVAIAVGNDHACALTSAGGVKCWGANEYGELGIGTTDHTSHPNPADVPGLTSGVTAIATGDFGTCAATIASGVKCWGRNTYGQLGNGTTIDSSVPVSVIGLTSGITALAMGETHTCAVTSGGGALCWGWNQYGALGNGSTVQSSTPVKVVGLTRGVTAVAVGQTYSCALTSRGAVRCWGFSMQLGNGSFDFDSHTPVAVTGLGTGVTGITANNEDACAVTSVGSVKCWGINAWGQLGIAPKVMMGAPTPVGVAGLRNAATAIAAATRDTCALTRGGGVMCWGDNTNGELGNGTTTNSSTPVVVSGLTGATAIAAGFLMTCALVNKGGVECWGNNTAGELGDGTTTNHLTPVAVNLP